jgi:hypothetical protein
MLKRFAIVILGLVAIVAAAPARAQHLSQTQAVAGQNYVSYADVSLAAGAAAIQMLAANPNRVTAICQNLGASNTARVGDANIGAAQGTVLYGNGAGVTLDVTGPVYAYSASGTTINCAEIVRP